MAKQNKNLKRTRDFLRAVESLEGAVIDDMLPSDGFDSMPEHEKIRYSRTRRKGNAVKHGKYGD